MGVRLVGLGFMIQSRRAREDCFRSIWREYYARLMVFVKCLGAAEEADREDLVQEIMEKIFRGIGTYNARYSFSTWVYAVARNHCLDAIKRRGRAPKQVPLSGLPESAQPAHDVSPERQLLMQEEDGRVRRLLSSADPETRQLAFLRYYERLGCGRIGEIMGIPVGTVKFRLHRLRENVRAHMEAGE
jgi:RNA polymerase sigma factor (sigma-70 family)